MKAELKKWKKRLSDLFRGQNNNVMLGDNMRKRIVFIMVTACILLIAGCGTSKNMSESHSLSLGELKESEDRELIGNQIPQWVSDADWNKPLFDK